MVLQCDAYDTELGAVLLREGLPVLYSSRALTATELNYAQIDKELYIFSTCLLQTVKFMATAPEKPTTIARIIAELILKNSQFSTKVQRPGISFLLQLLLCQVFPTLRKTARVFNKIITELLNWQGRTLVALSM